MTIGITEIFPHLRSICGNLSTDDLTALAAVVDARVVYEASDNIDERRAATARDVGYRISQLLDAEKRLRTLLERLSALGIRPPV